MTNSLLKNLYPEELYKMPVPTIFVMDKSWDDLTAAEQLTLAKLIKALKLNPDIEKSLKASQDEDAMIVALTPSLVQMVVMPNLKAEDIAAWAPARVVILGSHFQSSSKQYEPITFEHNTFVVADSISKLDDARKKSLWLALKKMFNI